jgi:hypothetical protein
MANGTKDDDIRDVMPKTLGEGNDRSAPKPGR